MQEFPDDVVLQAVEETAVEAARAAGDLIASRFGGPMEVMQKAEREGVDVVTDVDKESQRLIVSLIEKRFPSHMVLGEEDPPDEEPPAPDFVWAVDPIDGTKNYINGSAVHAVSIGVLYRGEAVAGAIWTPWPGEKGSVLAHARRAHGTWVDGKRIHVSAAGGTRADGEDGVPRPGLLAAVPGGLASGYKIKKPLRGNLGEVRVTGSTCYEMFMVATGSMQYALSGWANVWDFAAGLAIVQEAGGVTMTLDGGGWRPFTGWGGMFNGDAETSRRLRRWKGPVLSAAPATARFLSENLVPRRPGPFRRAWRSVTRR